MAKAAKRPQTAAEKLGEKLIIAILVLVPMSALVIGATHDKATATEPQQSTTTTVVADSIPPLAIDTAETPAPVVHQASKPKTISAPTTVPAQPQNVVVGGVTLIGCKPKPGVDVNAFWADYSKGGGDPYWPYVRGQVCA